ncbi:hypothetical protein CLPU_1c02100 [Gottschalkia purinilytica]|uniref:Beta-lactamase inhibitor (BLIP) n=1 Tax=Gottschalkia purinilytica TaxID=1503 RepID=A0A0L0WF50_GOTPU|nr:DUF3862 domain-containing protein [Gottschalkia purinilytica]KNF10045.1 hypothetical protein CLPU_1c02100 [Gottschalkia purinilytica]
MKKILSVVIVLVFAVVLYGCSEGAKKIEESIENENQIRMTNALSIEKPYDDIKKGMSYEEVRAILGDGIETISNSVAGMEGQSYEWKIDGELILIKFIDNKVYLITKSGSDIRHTGKEITINMYNKVREGMSYKEVISILGEGEKLASGKISGKDTATYHWVNKDGSNMHLMIENGKVSMKAQVNLK